MKLFEILYVNTANDAVSMVAYSTKTKEEAVKMFENDFSEYCEIDEVFG